MSRLTASVAASLLLCCLTAGAAWASTATGGAAAPPAVVAEPVGAEGSAPAGDAAARTAQADQPDPSAPTADDPDAGEAPDAGATPDEPAESETTTDADVLVPLPDDGRQPAPPGAAGQLPRTGLDIGPLALVGLLLFVTGIAVRAVARRSALR